MAETAGNMSGIVGVMGFGNAGERLYANEIAGSFEGITMVAYDPNPDKLQVKFDQTREAVQAAVDTGRIILGSITERPAAVMVIASPPGEHVNAIEHVLSEYADAGFPRPGAWIIEKAIVSSQEERSRLEALMESDLKGSGVFVHETRALSPALVQGAAPRVRELMEDSRLVAVNALAQKNRIPQVLAGRFSGNPLDVEAPHILVASQVLSGASLRAEHVVRNTVYENIDNIPEAEGSYTEFRVGEMTVRLAQGLGEYTIDYYGNMAQDKNPPMLRTVQAEFEDGQKVRVRFDPLGEGRPKLSSVFDHVDADGEVVDRQTAPERPIFTILAGALRHARGEASGLPKGTSVGSALETADLLLHLQRTATVVSGTLTA